jgi:glutamate dehydrogenase
MLSKAERAALVERTQAWVRLGVPQALAERAASLRFLLPGVDIVRVAEVATVGLMEAGKLYFRVGRKFGLEWLREATQTLPTRRAWDRQAVAALRDELFATQRAFTLSILQETSKDLDAAARVAAWRDARKGALQRWEQLLSELRATTTLDFAMVTVAARQLEGMIKAVPSAPSPAAPHSKTSLRSAAS